MQDKLISIIVGIVLVAGVGSVVYIKKEPPTLPLEADVIQPLLPTGITLAQIAKHNSRTSCLSTINGSVYDLTSWIPNHPGGEKAILYMCGIDGSAGYNKQHGGKVKPATTLAGFKIGSLAK